MLKDSLDGSEARGKCFIRKSDKQVYMCLKLIDRLKSML